MGHAGRARYSECLMLSTSLLTALVKSAVERSYRGPHLNGIGIRTAVNSIMRFATFAKLLSAVRTFETEVELSGLVVG